MRLKLEREEEKLSQERLLERNKDVSEYLESPGFKPHSSSARVPGLALSQLFL